MHQVQEGVERPRPTIMFEVGETGTCCRRSVYVLQRTVEDVDEERARLKVAVRSLAGQPRWSWNSAGRKALMNRVTVGGSAKSGPRTRVPLITEPVGQGEEVKWQRKISATIKLQVPAGQANPSPPIGPALGQRWPQHHGILQGVQCRNPELNRARRFRS